MSKQNTVHGTNHGAGAPQQSQMYYLQYVSERIIRVEVMERGRSITLTQVYTLCTNSCSLEERSEFFFF